MTGREGGRSGHLKRFLLVLFLRKRLERAHDLREYSQKKRKQLELQEEEGTMGRAGSPGSREGGGS